MADKVKVIMGGREKILDKRLAIALERIGKVKVVGDNQTYNTRMMTANNSQPVGTVSVGTVGGNVDHASVGTSEKEEYQKILDDAGIDYDRRLGEKKLKELVDSIKD